MKSECSTRGCNAGYAFVIVISALAVAFSPGQAQAKKRRAAPAAVANRDAAERQGELASCVSSYKSAQEQEQSGRLVDAKELFLTCAKPACGSVLLQECSSRFTRLNSDIPSVVLLVTDGSGAPLVDVQVRMDGEQLVSRLDGHSLPVDPGIHEFTYATAGTVFATQKVMILQGQRNVTVAASTRPPAKRTAKERAKERAVALAGGAPSVVLPGQAAPIEADSPAEPDGAPESGFKGAVAGTVTDTTEAKSHAGALTYLLAGAGAAGVGGFALLTYWGRKDNRMLGQCASSCPQSSVDHIQKVYLGANISLGVGVAALGAAYWAYAHARSTKEETGSHEQAFMFGVEPTKSGAVAGVSGAF
jgi:hypothetical protein